MEWTKEKPTKPGRYILREFGSPNRMRLCEAFIIDGVMYVTAPDNRLSEIYEWMKGEWLGPLED